MKDKQRQQEYGFLGQYETRVLGDGRIRLPAEVVRQLSDCSVKKIRPGIMPKEKALVLWPDILWEQWTNCIREQFPVLVNADSSRVFLAASKPTRWDRQGRIYISTRLREYASIVPGQAILIVGVNDHFELWPQKAFDEVVARCERALQG